MISFAQFAAESFNSTVNLVWDVSGGRWATATFSLESIAVQVLFEQQEPGSAWNVSFDVNRDERHQAIHAAFHIFNGVFQAVREFLEVRHPDLLVFATKRDDLASVYEAYLRREKSSIELLGYQLEGPQRVDPYVEYTLRRASPPRWVS